MEHAIGSESHGYNKLSRDANVITNQISNFSTMCIIQMSHDLFFIRVIDLSLNKIEEPRVERVAVLKDNRVNSVVTTRNGGRIISIHFAQMEFLSF